MNNDSELYTPVVFTLEELKEIYDKDAYGKKGMWGFHSKFHKGHKKCATLTNDNSDWVLGIYWNNFAEGLRWMVGDVIDVDNPIIPSDITAAKKYSDVVMVFTGDYHPCKEHWKHIKSEFDKEFPEEFLDDAGILKELNIYSSLLYGVAIRVLIHELYGIKIDYQTACGRDRWRHIKYNKWLLDRFGLEYNLIDAVRDDHGNVISGMKNRGPKEFLKRIKKPLLLPTFENIQEVNEYISDIEDLEAVHFAKEYGWIHVKFQFAGRYWWSEGLKL